jgi:hypothetical protein
MSDSDKDFRFMAASDLMAELAKEAFKLDRYEPKVRPFAHLAQMSACRTTGCRCDAEAPG